MIILKSLREVEWMREAAKALFEIHLGVSQPVKAGITALTLECRVKELMDLLGVQSSYLGYRRCPGAAYLGINEGVSHSPRSERVL
jgi:methionyl aminopeptidase